MRVLRGISNGMVMQRGKNGCEIVFTAEHHGEMRSSMGRVEALEDGRARLTGIPTGGPYALEIADGETSVRFEDIYVGDVWILAGQSNMEGAGLRRAQELEYDSHPNPAIRACYLDGHWDAARSQLHHQWMNLDAGVREKYRADNHRFLELYGSFDVEPASLVGPGHFIGLRMYELTSVPQGLLPCAYGGSSMKDWTPDNDTPASLYRSMLRIVEDCGGHARGIFWYQGEGEAHPEGIERYNANMRRFISALRKDLGEDKMPFVQAQIGHCSLPQVSNPEGSENWQRIRELQRRLPEEIPGTSTVSTANSYLQDLIHIDAQSHQELGRGMAEEMYRLCTGQGAKQPELALVETKPHPIKRGFRRIILTYENVIGSLVSDGRPYGFSLTLDDERPFEYPQRYLDSISLEGNQVVIAVEESYVPEDRAFLWYGACLGSVCNIRDEAGRALCAFGPRKLLD